MAAILNSTFKENLKLCPSGHLPFELKTPADLMLKEGSSLEPLSSYPRNVPRPCSRFLKHFLSMVRIRNKRKRQNSVHLTLPSTNCISSTFAYAVSSTRPALLAHPSCGPWSNSRAQSYHLPASLPQPLPGKNTSPFLNSRAVMFNLVFWLRTHLSFLTSGLCH